MNRKHTPIPTQKRQLARSAGGWMALEERLMFDAAAVDTAVQMAADQLPPEPIAADSEPVTEPATRTISEQERPQENMEAAPQASVLVFIDSALPDYQTLVDAIPADAEVHVIDAGVDGFAYMAEVMDERSDIDAVHVLGHGSAGAATLGSAVLNTYSLSDYSDELAAIGEAMTAEGDILLYGCNIAADQTGVDFIGSVAALTGADVAASDDLTGASELGGDWELEVQHGETIGFLDDMQWHIYDDVLSQGTSTLTSWSYNNATGHVTFNISYNYKLDYNSGTRGVQWWDSFVNFLEGPNPSNPTGSLQFTSFANWAAKWYLSSIH
jgi:hypothetical protein